MSYCIGMGVQICFEVGSCGGFWCEVRAVEGVERKGGLGGLMRLGLWWRNCCGVASQEEWKQLFSRKSVNVQMEIAKHLLLFDLLIHLLNTRKWSLK